MRCIWRSKPLGGRRMVQYLGEKGSRFSRDRDPKHPAPLVGLRCHATEATHTVQLTHRSAFPVLEWTSRRFTEVDQDWQLDINLYPIAEKGSHLPGGRLWDLVSPEHMYSSWKNLSKQPLTMEFCLEGLEKLPYDWGESPSIFHCRQRWF